MGQPWSDDGIWEGQGLSWGQGCPVSRALRARQGFPRQIPAELLGSCRTCWGFPGMVGSSGCAPRARPMLSHPGWEGVELREQHMHGGKAASRWQGASKECCVTHACPCLFITQQVSLMPGQHAQMELALRLHEGEGRGDSMLAEPGICCKAEQVLTTGEASIVSHGSGVMHAVPHRVAYCCWLPGSKDLLWSTGLHQSFSGGWGGCMPLAALQHYRRSLPFIGVADC